MIASLRGRLLSQETQHVVVECGGVGYGVSMSLTGLSQLRSTQNKAPTQEEVFLHIYTHVTQDNLRLFGFVELAERRVFEVLLGTTGVGPRLALAILSTMTPAELTQAIAEGNKTSLTCIPGVGGKTAARLLVELKDRLEKMDAESPSTTGAGTVRRELQEALLQLGFAPAIATQAAQQALTSLPQQTDLAQLMREALRSTTQSGSKKAVQSA